jgi:hypothetical protein
MNKTEKTQNIAQRLGYLRKIKAYSCEARKQLDLFVNGRYKKDTLEWLLDNKWKTENMTASQLRNIDAMTSELKRDFLCIRCLSSSMRTHSLFCDKCEKYILLMSSLPSDVVYAKVDAIEQTNAYVRLSWIAKLPVWTYGMPCHFCKRTYNTLEDIFGYEMFCEDEDGCLIIDYVDWTDGLKRSCCTVCLHEKYTKNPS